MIEYLKKQKKSQKFIMDHFQMTMQAIAYSKFLRATKQNAIATRKKTLVRRQEHHGTIIRKTKKPLFLTSTRR